MKIFTTSRSAPPRRSAKTPPSIIVALTATLIAGAGGCVHAQNAARAQDAPTATAAAEVQTEPLLHPLFSENAVLQRDRPVPIWGWTQPRTKVTVKLDNKVTQTATAGDDGRWTVSLAPHAAGGPHSLTVVANDRTETRNNLLFGDVWLCSGQSNMAYDLHGALNPEQEIAAANHPNIRLIQVLNTAKGAPVQSFGGNWKVCSPQTVGTFSATGYFFGRELHSELKIPIGLIDSSWSGTPGQAWVSGPALARMPEFKPTVDALTQNAGDSFAAQTGAWWKKNNQGATIHQEATDFDDAGWQAIDEPGFWEEKGFPNYDGVMWFRRVVDVPADWAGRDLKLNLGSVDDNDVTFWNGTAIGTTQGWNNQRVYTVPAAQVKVGRTVIAIRVEDTGNSGGLAGPTLSMQSGNNTVSLAGAWKVQKGAALGGQTARPMPFQDPNTPTVLWNSKIAPLLPGAIKGILWYQGESNADSMEEATQYRRMLPILITDWHAHFGAQTPFYVMQLANFKAPDDVPNDAPWPRLREAQLLAARSLPNTYLTVITDLGEENNVHFPNKQGAGARLALNALEHTYGRKIESSGPTLKDLKAAGSTMQLSFDHAQGLGLKGDANRVFALAGTDLKFYWAMPQIAGNLVTLRSPDVPRPLYARYAWSDNPRANLINAAGLPASPFRTDGDTRFPVAPAQDKADAVFDAWNAAFLERSKGETYYTRTTTDLGVESEGSWVFALDLQTAEDAYARTHSPAHRRLVTDLLDTFLQQNNNDWAKNDWNDDMGWMSLALVRGYQITGDKKYLDKAVYAWSLAYDRGWDTKYGGGGVWENMGDVRGKPQADKLALSNDPFINSGVTLYQITGDAAYLTKSKAMYAWIRDNVFDKKTGNVNQGVKWFLNQPGKPETEHSSNIYNIGSFIVAANQLYRVTGDTMYHDDAQLAVDFVVDKIPVLNNNGGYQNQWAYWFVKGLNEFATDNNQWPKYRRWMQANADAVWQNRDALNLTGNNWLKVNDDPKINANETSSSVAVWQLLPPADADALAGNYILRSVASKLALSVAADSAAPGAAVVQQADPPAASAVWTLVPTSGGYYQIKNANSGLVMAVAGASVRAGARIVQRAARGLNPGDDQWWPVRNADGTYSFVNRNSQQALDDPALATEPGTQYAQWFGNSSYAQQFNLIPQK